MSSRRVMSTSWPPLTITVLGVLLLLFRYDVPALDLVAYGLYLLLGIAVPGVFVWRLLLRQLHLGDKEPPTWFEDLALGTIFGFGVQLPVYLIGVWIGVPLLIVVLPVAVLGISLTPRGRDVWSLPTRTLDPPASWFLGATILYGVAWLGRHAFLPRPLSLPDNRPPSVDETFHQALIAETSHRFPPQIPFLLDTRLDYHWFVHAQIAASNHATGLDSVVMLRQVMPAVVLALSVVGLGAVALRLTGRPVAAVIAPALLVAGAYQLIGPHYDTFTFSEPYMSRRFVTSPSQSYGVMISLPALALILEVLRPGRKAARLTWTTLALALLALSGAKATFLPLFLCGAIAIWALTLVFARRLDRTLSALVVLLVIAAAFAQFVLFGGQTGGMAVDPFTTMQAALHSEHINVTAMSRFAMLGMLLVSWLLYGVGVVGLARAGRWRDPRAVMMAFSVAAGLGVAFVFFRSGLSQLWFQRSVAELVVLLSAWGMSELLPRPFTRRHATVFGGAAAAAGLVAWLLASFDESRHAVVGQGTYHALVYTVAVPVLVVAGYLILRLVRRRAPSLPRPSLALLLSVLLGLGLMNVYALGYDTLTQRHVRVPRYPPLFAPGGVTAAAYIDDHSDVDDVVATNVHCLRPHAPKCDNRSFWVSANTERRIVIEGWGYTAATNKHFVAGQANSFIPPPDPGRLRLNDAAFRRPSESTVGALVDAYDPSWLFVDKDYAADVAGLKDLDGGVLTKSFENKHYVVFHIND